MAISIRITADVIGESILYSKENKEGAKHAVPLYRLTLSNKTGTKREFGVTRDTIRTIGKAEQDERYALFGECPPNKKDVPYEAAIRRDGERGFRLQLFESGIEQKNEQYLLQGIGPIKRQYIQIHIGPSHSRGCFLLTDDFSGRQAFQEAVEELMEEDERNDHKGHDSFVVYVDER